MVSLSEVARKIHLWFDPEIHDPDLPLLPLKWYVTDGSFSTPVKDYFDILTPDDNLCQQGKGAAAIVFLSPALDRAPIPHTVRIITQNPSPGMTAYAWELLAQLVALKLTQYYPASLQGYSDCKATIDRMNVALSTSTDRLGFTTAGILATSAHAHSSPSHPRTISYVAAHPERDAQRWNHPTQLDKAIFLADAIAGQTTTKYNKQFIDHKAHTLILENILAEILPIGVWHMRHTSQLSIPVLDLPWKYQHQFQLSQYLLRRDQYGPPHSQRWRDTEIDFAVSVHPIPSQYNGSFWTAARRTCILYDWMGHGYNTSKRNRKNHPHTALPVPPMAPCKFCSQHDDQAHIMLTCTNPLLSPIRIAARVHQATIARQLLRESSSNTERFFIEQLNLASWLSSPPVTARIWTGMWTKETLIALLPPSHDMLSPMCRAD